jgi:hypothetical protein
MVRGEVSSSAASADAEGQEPDLMRWWMRRMRSQWIFEFRFLIFDFGRRMGEVSLKRGKRKMQNAMCDMRLRRKDWDHAIHKAQSPN